MGWSELSTIARQEMPKPNISSLFLLVWAPGIVAQLVRGQIHSPSSKLRVGSSSGRPIGRTTAPHQLLSLSLSVFFLTRACWPRPVLEAQHVHSCFLALIPPLIGLVLLHYWVAQFSLLSRTN